MTLPFLLGMCLGDVIGFAIIVSAAYLLGFRIYNKHDLPSSAEKSEK